MLNTREVDFEELSANTEDAMHGLISDLQFQTRIKILLPGSNKKLNLEFGEVPGTMGSISKFSG
jgi:hypothetical protein